MHRRIGTSIITLTLAAGLVSIVAACTATTVEPSDGSSTKKDSGTPSSSGSSGNDKTPGDDDDDDTTKDCSKETTAATCATCCGYNQQIEDILDESDGIYIACACEDKCKTACGDFCTNQQQEPSEACMTCLDSQAVITECGPKAEEPCTNSDACTAFFDCEEKSSCSQKSQPDGG
ncbi:MAG: hypothetical protein KF764_19480 [Labilithrix sp.]|nr:hypothetical protein [Labilithrix sp.]